MKIVIGQKKADDAEVLRGGMAPEELEDPRHRAVPLVSAEASHRELRPHERDADEDERDEVGNHEGAAAVARRLHGESQEVAEADGVSRERENQTDLRSPSVLVPFIPP